MTFDECFEIVMEIEGFGAIVNDSADNGGLTKWGISQAAYPNLSAADIKAMTKVKAKALYKRDYWDKVGAGKVPRKLSLALFDASVNHGVLGASKLLQRSANALGARLSIDGVIGPLTLSAVKGMDAVTFLVQFSTERLKLYEKHEDYARFGKGWTRRLFKVALETV